MFNKSDDAFQVITGASREKEKREYCGKTMNGYNNTAFYEAEI